MNGIRPMATRSAPAPSSPPTPNELMSTLHNRMPVILDKKNYADWLDPAPQTPENLLPLIQPFPADRMSAYPVSTLVNTPGNDRPECIVPA